MCSAAITTGCLLPASGYRSHSVAIFCFAGAENSSDIGMLPSARSSGGKIGGRVGAVNRRSRFRVIEPPMPEDLGRVERLARGLGRVGNETERGQRFQNALLRRVSYVWVRQVLANRILAEGLDDVCAMAPPAGVLFVSNHRSFFDLYSLLLA